MGNVKHGLYKHVLYKTWLNIKSRCYYKSDIGYHNYGGRGITMCDEWRDNFKAFYDYVIELSNYGKDGYTLDRKENGGNYEPNNLRWVTDHIQKANRRKQHDNTSGYRGVSKNSDKFKSELSINGDRIYIGSFPTSIDAAKARDLFIIDNELWEYPLQTF